MNQIKNDEFDNCNELQKRYLLSEISKFEKLGYKLYGNITNKSNCQDILFQLILLNYDKHKNK